jgi:hypothetical protein
MSLNLDNETVLAIQKLRGTPAFPEMLTAFARLANRQIHKAIECDPDHRVEQTAYARAFRDIFVAMQATYTGQRQNVVSLPDDPAESDPAPKKSDQSPQTSGRGAK